MNFWSSISRQRPTLGSTCFSAIYWRDCKFSLIIQVLASRESLVESIEESESDDAILMSQVRPRDLVKYFRI